MCVYVCILKVYVRVCVYLEGDRVYVRVCVYIEGYVCMYVCVSIRVYVCVGIGGTVAWDQAVNREIVPNYNSTGQVPSEQQSPGSQIKKGYAVPVLPLPKPASPPFYSDQPGFLLPRPPPAASHEDSC